MVDEEEGGALTLRYSNGPLFECSEFDECSKGAEEAKAGEQSGSGGHESNQSKGWSRSKERAYQAAKYNYKVLMAFDSRR
jgi:hypothetical protein